MKKKLLAVLAAASLALSMSAGIVSAENAIEYDRLVSLEKLSKYVKLGDYKNLKLERTTKTVTEEDIDAAIKDNLDAHKEGVNDAVAEGDLVTIDYVGLADGEEFAGGSAEGYSMEVTEGTESEGLIGMKKGETKELSLALPTENTDITGETTFRVTLRLIYRAPELTDEWVADNTESKTIAEYREAVRKQLEERADRYATIMLQNDAWQQVVENSEVKEYPEEDVVSAREDMQKINEQYAEQAGMEFEDFLESQGYDSESYEALEQEYAENIVRTNMLLQAIMDEEDITLGDDVTKECEQELLKDFGAESLDEIASRFSERSVLESIAMLRIERFLVDNAEITEQAAQGDTVGIDTQANN